MTQGTVFDEAGALRYPLFQDDFGEPGDKALSDRIMTCRQTASCCECLGPIETGTRYRKHVGVYGGAMREYKFCAECCAAMAKTFSDGDDRDYDAMAERSALRAARAKGDA